MEEDRSTQEIFFLLFKKDDGMKVKTFDELILFSFEFSSASYTESHSIEASSFVSTLREVQFFQD